MAATNSPASGRTRPAPPLPSPIVHLSFSTDLSCFIVAGASTVHYLSCETFELRCLYEEKDAKKIIVAAGSDMLRPMDSACATVSRIVDDTACQTTRFSIKRWKPGFKNYHWRYAEKEIVTEGKADVRAVRVHGDKTLVVHADRLEVLGPNNTKDGALALHLLATGDNPLGLCAVSSSQGSDAAPFAFACPGAKVGEVHVERWEGAQRPVVTIRAHSSSLASIAMSCDGRLVATASVTGTLVRIFLAADGALLQELRRGSDRANIHSIAFSPDSKWLAVASDKATVHVFSVNVDLPSPTPENGNVPDGLQAEAEAEAEAEATASTTASPPSSAVKANKRSSLSFLGGFLPGYFSSEWSLAQFRAREGTKHSVAFGKQPNTVVIIGMDGSFYRCRFDPEKGGDMEQLEHMNFMDLFQKTLSPPIS